MDTNQTSNIQEHLKHTKNSSLKLHLSYSNKLSYITHLTRTTFTSYKKFSVSIYNDNLSYLYNATSTQSVHYVVSSHPSMAQHHKQTIAKYCPGMFLSTNTKGFFFQHFHKKSD